MSEAINHPIQATAADIMKLAMLRVDTAIQAYGNGARLLLQVHDELIVEVPVAHQAAIAALLRREMSAAGLHRTDVWNVSASKTHLVLQLWER